MLQEREREREQTVDCFHNGDSRHSVPVSDLDVFTRPICLTYCRRFSQKAVRCGCGLGSLPL